MAAGGLERGLGRDCRHQRRRSMLRFAASDDDRQVGPSPGGARKHPGDRGGGRGPAVAASGWAVRGGIEGGRAARIRAFNPVPVAGSAQARLK